MRTYYILMRRGKRNQSNKEAGPHGQRAGNWFQMDAAGGDKEQRHWDEDKYPILWGFMRHFTS